MASNWRFAVRAWSMSGLGPIGGTSAPWSVHLIEYPNDQQLEAWWVNEAVVLITTANECHIFKAPAEHCVSGVY